MLSFATWTWLLAIPIPNPQPAPQTTPESKRYKRKLFNYGIKS